MDATRALLDSLMGADRNVGSKEAKKSFKDDDVCKHYLVWECPHSMFEDQSGKAAAKSPLGPCPKRHMEVMKERLKEDKDYDMYRHRYLCGVQAALQKLVAEVDRKRKHNKEVVLSGISCSKETAGVLEGDAKARRALVEEKLAAAEKYATEGDFEMSQKVMAEADTLSRESRQLMSCKEGMDNWVDEVCDVCGRQISWRAPEEIEARKRGRPHPHTMGTWHQGFMQARESLKQIDEELKALSVDERPNRRRERSRTLDGRRRGGRRSADRRRAEEGSTREQPAQDRDRAQVKDRHGSRSARSVDRDEEGQDRRRFDEREHRGDGRRDELRREARDSRRRDDRGGSGSCRSNDKSRARESRGDCRGRRDCSRDHIREERKCEDRPRIRGVRDDCSRPAETGQGR
mmetsp:Transcript_90645/g.255949  ORF Transcript_90645/g.255949 Transcript_90645/m.255949 type:complete len:404 (+) Transcript_90645:47-1258(+)